MPGERGMVVKIEGRSCIAVTPDGEFRQTTLPKGSDIRIGQEISLADRRRTLPYIRYFIAAASFLLIFMFYFIRTPHTTLAVAYLTMDINPSIELAISGEGKVVSGSGLNSDGKKILSEIAVEGIDLEQAVGLIVTQAITDNYLTAEDSNVILTTLTVDKDSEPLVDLEIVYNAIKTSMDSGGVASEVIIETVAPEMRREAEKSGISTGRFLLQKKTMEKNLPVSPVEINEMSLNKIEKEKQVSIAQLFGGDGSGIREYNLWEDNFKENEGSGVVKQGLYAGRNNASLWIKVRPQDNGDSEKDKNKDNGNEKYKENNIDNSWNNSWNSYWNNNLNNNWGSEKDNDKDNGKDNNWGANSWNNNNRGNDKGDDKDSDKDSDEENDRDNSWGTNNWGTSNWGTYNWGAPNWSNNNWNNNWNNWNSNGDSNEDNDRDQNSKNNRNSPYQNKWKR